MAINVKKILADELLELINKQNLQTITIKQLLDATGISRQTFYNHFIDKNDLIQYIYNTRIVPGFDISKPEISFYDSLLETLENMKTYHVFMKQACMMEGQNCLKDYIFEHCEQFDLQYHRHLYGKDLPEPLIFATIYHAHASSSMTLSWILSDMPVSTKEIAKLIVNMRSLGMDQLFGENKNPYKD